MMANFADRLWIFGLEKRRNSGRNFGSQFGPVRYNCWGPSRRGGRAADCTGLEHRRGVSHRGFESLPLRCRPKEIPMELTKPTTYAGRLAYAQRLVKSAQFRSDPKLAVRELCEAIGEL